MLDTMTSLLPIYALLALGAIAIRTRLVAPDALPHLSRFVLVICMPVIVASAVMRAGDLSDFNWPFILGYGLAGLLTFLLGSVVMARLFGMPGPMAAMMGLGVCSSNSIFLGYPIGGVLFPEQVDVVFSWIIVAENLIVLPVAIIVAEALAGEKGRGVGLSMRQTFGQMLRSPVLIGLVAGLLIGGLHLPVTGPVEATRGLIAAAAPLVSLFFIGGTVAITSMRSRGGPVLVIALGKLVIHPAIALAVLAAMPGVSLDYVAIGAVFAAMPMIAIFPILASRFGASDLASSALVFTTLLGGVTVSALAIFM
ncbi:AEC family transporter [Tropicibacter sp. S64]|uniref:AEC family transporter n=1 Tax=Tropicibacter sp. S64 TaxID=3415122 RepID=UPI003C7D9DF6